MHGDQEYVKPQIIQLLNPGTRHPAISNSEYQTVKESLSHGYKRLYHAESHAEHACACQWQHRQPDQKCNHKTEIQAFDHGPAARNNWFHYSIHPTPHQASHDEMPHPSSEWRRQTGSQGQPLGDTIHQGNRIELRQPLPDEYEYRQNTCGHETSGDTPYQHFNRVHGHSRQ